MCLHNWLQEKFSLTDLAVWSQEHKRGAITNNRTLSKAKSITEHWEIFTGDLILADRDFTIHDSAGLHCAEVKTPSFNNPKQNNFLEILHFRIIHVEWVIGMLQLNTKLCCLSPSWKMAMIILLIVHLLHAQYYVIYVHRLIRFLYVAST